MDEQIELQISKGAKRDMKRSNGRSKTIIGFIEEKQRFWYYQISSEKILSKTDLIVYNFVCKLGIQYFLYVYAFGTYGLAALRSVPYTLGFCYK